MTLRQLQYFVRLVDEGSFTRAAERLFVAQPSLSQQIRALEDELGGSLIERLPRGIRLTGAGKALLPEARAAVEHAETAARSVRGALGLESGELEVASVTSGTVGLLPPTLQRWHEVYGGTTIRLREFLHRDLLAEAVRAGVGDIAVGPRPSDWPGPVEHLGWEEFVVVLPHHDPLAGEGGALALEALADRDWVLFEAHHGLAELTDQVCARAGFVPRGAVRTGQVGAAAGLAAAGLGCALLPDNVVPPSLDAPVRPLAPPLTRELVAFARGEWSTLASAFLELLRERPWGDRPPDATVIGP